MAHPFHHALSSAKKWGGGPEDYLSPYLIYRPIKSRRSRLPSPSNVTPCIRHTYARTAFWTRNPNLHRPHRTRRFHRRATYNRRSAEFQRLPIGPAASARNLGWAARSRFTSRSTPSRAPLRQKDHDNVCDLSPPPPPGRCELASRRPRRRLAISAARPSRRLQTASPARLLPDNDRATRQSSVARARAPPLTPPSTKTFQPKRAWPRAGLFAFRRTL